MAKPGAWEHPKTRKLARALGVRHYAAFGLFSRLLDVTARLAPRGDIGKIEPCDIAHELAWEGDPEVLIRALVEAGLLDWFGRGKKSVLVVHDWAEHTGELVHAKLARAQQTFITGQIPNLRKLEAEERKRAEEYFRDFELKSGRPARARKTANGRHPARSPPKPDQKKPNHFEVCSSELKRGPAGCSAPLDQIEGAQGSLSRQQLVESGRLNEDDRRLRQIQEDLMKKKAIGTRTDELEPLGTYLSDASQGS